MRAGLLAVAALLAACDEEPVTAYHAVPGSSEGDDFYALPFPNDLRRHADGRLDLSAFPTNAPIVETVRMVAERDLDGFGLNAALFARFSGPLDPATLPTPAQSMTDTASVYVVDVDPDSPTRGERWPVVVTFRPENTQTMGGNRLAVRPYPGFPLYDQTTYALVITTRARAASGGPIDRDADFGAIMTGGGSAAIEHARGVYQPLIDWLDEPGGEEPNDVVAASVFTTQDAISIMPAIRRAVYGTAAPVATGVMNVSAFSNTSYVTFQGQYTAPNIQTGTPAYITTGGEVIRDASGNVVVQRMEQMRFSVTIPTGTVPPAGFPICIYQHGTTGDWVSYFEEGTAERLAAQGIATISTDQVLHGPRDPTGTDPSIAFFNFNNPVAARDNPLQGVADAWSQLRLALGMQLTDGPRTIRFDPDRVYFWGHSQGGLTGPGFVAFEPSLDGAVLSGTAGVFYLNVLDKIEPVNFPDLIATLVRDEPVDEDNPTLALAQMAVERQDPVNYAQLMARRPQLAPDGSPLAPRNIFQTEGFVDNYSPNRGIEAFAVALGADLVMLPDTTPLEGLTLRGRQTMAPPFSNNYGTATVALGQYKAPGTSDGHFVATSVASARKQTAEFLGTLAATGQATVVSP